MNTAIIMHSDTWLGTVDNQMSTDDWGAVDTNRVLMERLMQWENTLADCSITYDWDPISRLESPVMTELVSVLEQSMAEGFRKIPSVKSVYCSEIACVTQLWVVVDWQEYDDDLMDEILDVVDSINEELTGFDVCLVSQAVPKLFVNPSKMIPESARQIYGERFHA